MRHAIILAQSETTANALDACWSLAEPGLAKSPNGQHDPDQLDHSLRLVCECTNHDATDTYRLLCTKIRRFLETNKPTNGRTLVLVDNIHPESLNPMHSGWSALVAMLILTFPDLGWYFGVTPNSDKSDPSSENGDPTDFTDPVFPRKACSLPALFEPLKDALFDYSGLRHWIRSVMHRATGKDERKVAPPLPLREKLAVALDDERSYAYFHAYTAYRFGFRALPVTEERIANQWFQQDSDSKMPFLSLEDLFLNFPDREDNPLPLSDLLCGRDKRWPMLKENKVVHRVFVTSGQRHFGDGEKRAKNRVYMRAPFRECGQHRWYAFKPTGGMFDLWHQTELDRRLRWRCKHTERAYQGVGPGYIWPPPPQYAFEGDSGHSAPGRLLLVAESLLERCGEIRNRGMESVEEAVRGAVLAGSALELLGDRTPTTGLEALALKHQFEVLAECQFSGVEYHLMVKPRLEEIGNEVRAIGRWFSRTKRKDAVLNAEMMIVNSLITIFRQHNQFEEEQLCMIRARQLHNTLWMRQRQRRLPLPWRYVFWPLLRYAEFLLTSLPRFILGLGIWTVALSALFSLANSRLDIGNVPEVHPLSMVISTFFGAGSLTASHPVWIVLTSIGVLGGLAHLGIFISHLYTIVSRK